MNMNEEFIPSCINLLGEIMMDWFNKYEPRFMCVLCKYHHFCNENQTICCGLTSILWRAQIAEGKYLPKQIGQKEYNE